MEIAPSDQEIVFAKVVPAINQLLSERDLCRERPRKIYIIGLLRFQAIKNC